MQTVVYRCHPCRKEYNPDDLPDLEEFDEEGNWQYPYPNCGKPVVWGLNHIAKPEETAQ